MFRWSQLLDRTKHGQCKTRYPNSSTTVVETSQRMETCVLESRTPSTQTTDTKGQPMKRYTFLFDDGSEFHVIGYNWNDALGRFATVAETLKQSAGTIKHILEKS